MRLRPDFRAAVTLFHQVSPGGTGTRPKAGGMSSLLFVKSVAVDFAYS